MTKNGDDRSAHLLDEFRRPTYPEWRAEAERMLAGTAFEKRLFTPTVEGITLRPLYTAADDAKLPHLGGQPSAVNRVSARSYGARGRSVIGKQSG